MEAILTATACLIIHCLVGIFIGITVWGTASCRVVHPKSNYDNEEDCDKDRKDFIRKCVYEIFSWF